MLNWKLRSTVVFGRSFHDRQVSMRITVLFSGLFRSLAGVEHEVLDVAVGTTLDQLSRILVQKYQNLDAWIEFLEKFIWAMVGSIRKDSGQTHGPTPAIALFVA